MSLWSEDREGFLEVLGAQLEYQWLAGAGAPFILLHEGLGCVSMWRDFPANLRAATGRGVFLYSRAGYGGSDPASLPRPVRYMHDEALVVLPALLAKLGIDDCILVGHSDGGSISLIYAGGMERPGCSGLVLMAPHVFNESITIASIALARDSYERTDLRERLARHHGSNVDCAFRGWNDVWLSEAFASWNIESFLPGVRVPVLLLQGLDDEYGTTAQLDAIRAGVAGPVEQMLLADCGHAPHRDRPEEVIAAIRAAFVRQATG